MTLTAENFGDVVLNSVVITDDIVTQFALVSPTGFTASYGPFSANPAWVGTGSSNILAADQSLTVGESKTMLISFIVTPGSITEVQNTAYVSGQSPAGTTVTDQSTDGLDPDADTIDDNTDGTTDGDGNPDEEIPAPVVFQPAGTIGDQVWWDIDGNGVQDPGEPGIPGVELVLTDGVVRITTSTPSPTWPPTATRSRSPTPSSGMAARWKTGSPLPKT